MSADGEIQGAELVDSLEGGDSTNRFRGSWGAARNVLEVAVNGAQTRMDMGAYLGQAGGMIVHQEGAYALVVSGDPQRNFECEWVNTETGEVVSAVRMDEAAGEVPLPSTPEGVTANIRARVVGIDPKRLLRAW